MVISHLRRTGVRHLNHCSVPADWHFHLDLFQYESPLFRDMLKRLPDILVALYEHFRADPRLQLEARNLQRINYRPLSESPLEVFRPVEQVNDDRFYR